jgi:hypothetical protein
MADARPARRLRHLDPLTSASPFGDYRCLPRLDAPAAWPAVLTPFRGPPWSCRRAVVVMQPAEHGDRRDRAGEPGSDPFARERDPLVDPLVGPSRVEVAQCVFSDDLLQVRLGQDDQVIEAFRAGRSPESVRTPNSSAAPAPPCAGRESP